MTGVASVPPRYAPPVVRRRGLGPALRLCALRFSRTRAGRLPRIAAWALSAILCAPLLSLAACDGSPVVPDEDPPIVVDARVNVQMGDTPVGERPVFIVTGRVEATQGGAARPASIDSIVVDYTHNTGAWTRLRRTTLLPFSDVLPFVVAAGDVYRLHARLYASARDGAGVLHSDTAEWVASGAARSP